MRGPAWFASDVLSFDTHIHTHTYILCVCARTHTQVAYCLWSIAVLQKSPGGAAPKEALLAALFARIDVVVAGRTLGATDCAKILWALATLGRLPSDDSVQHLLEEAEVPNPEPYTLAPDPYTLDPKPSTLNPQP